MRALLALCLSLVWAGFCFAQERITNYDIDIQVEQSGDMIITETIELISEGDQIRRGIFRELPARYSFMGVRQSYEYELLDVERNGFSEPVTRLREGNAMIWRIGQSDVLIDPGYHEYVIRYRVSNQLRRHEGEEARDEVFWNATGTYWNFPIERAVTTVRFPSEAEIMDAAVKTGSRGSTASDATVSILGPVVRFETTEPLPRKSGMTVSASIAPGVIAPMSAERRAQLFWIRYGAPILSAIGAVGILAYYLMLWNRVGRDPQKPPVFPRYAPPKGYSPAAVHYIYHRGHKAFDALSAQLLKMGTDGTLEIEADKSVTTLKLTGQPMQADSRKLVDILFDGRNPVVMDGETDSSLYKDVMTFMNDIRTRYGRDYYRHNLGWAFLGFFVSIALFVGVMVAPVAKSGLMVAIMLIGLIAINGLFLFLLPAPTQRGSKIHAEIEGFRLYLETAEEDRLNTGGPLKEQPPAMTIELYERFLPYAVALGVEKPWTQYFKTVLPREAAEYKPAYAHGSKLTKGGSFRPDFGKQLGKALTSGVAAAAPVSQSSSSGGFSSGSGGGGFSGGGGGGGGGGGW